MRSRRAAWRIVPAALVAVLFLAPGVLMASGAFRAAPQPPPTGPELIPDPISTANFGEAVRLGDLGRQAVNSLLVAAIAVPVSVLVASMAGFALARLGGRTARTVVVGAIVALMVPATALFVGRFWIFRALGVTDTWIPLIAPALLGMSPMYVLVYLWSFRRVPPELFDAARLEGLSPLGTWWRVGMPLVRPITGAVAVLAFVASWNDFTGPLLYLFDSRLYTLPLGLRSLSTLDAPYAPVMLAGALLATVPVLVAFLVAQRRFMRGVRAWGWSA